MTDEVGMPVAGRSCPFLQPRNTFVTVVAIVVFSHLMLSALGAAASNVIDPYRPASNLASHELVEQARQELSPVRAIHLWYNWDAIHYERLSDHWFDVRPPLQPNVVAADGGRAWDEFSWPPLYPVVVGIVHRLTFVDAGRVMVILGVVLQVMFVWLLRRLSIEGGDDDETAMAVVLVAVAMPFAFFLGTPLTEPLFVTCAVLSLLAMRQRRWLVAGLAAAAMPWTKNIGVLMVVPLLVDGVLEIRRREDRTWSVIGRALAPAVMCSASFVAYLGFARWLTGTPWAPFDTQRVGWGNTTGDPINTLLRGLDQWQYIAVAMLLVTTIVLGIRRWISLTEVLFSVVMLLAASSVSTIAPAAPRYASVAFPVAVGLARWASARSVLPYLVSVCALVQGAVFVIWSTYWLGEMY